MDPDQIPFTYRIRRLLGKWIDAITWFFDIGHHLGGLVSWFQIRGDRKRYQKELREKTWEIEGRKPPAWRRFGHFLGSNWLILTLAALLAGGGAAYKISRRTAGDSASADIWKKAQTQFQQGKWADVEQTLNQFVGNKKHERQAVWMIFRARKELKVPRAVDAAFWLGSQKDITGDELFEILDYLAGPCPQGSFFAMYSRLSTMQQQEPRFKALFARCLTRRGDFAAVEKLFEGEWEAEDLLVREHARLRCKTGKAGDLREARQDFITLQDRNPVEALTVLRLLAAQPGGVLRSPADDFPALHYWLEGHPAATVEDKLIAFDQKLPIEKKPGQTAAEVVESFGQTHPGDVTRWLNRQGLYDESVLFASRPEADRKQVFGPLIEGLIGKKQFPAAKLTLSVPPPDFDSIDLALLKVRYAMAANDEPDAAWRSAHEAVAADKRLNRAIDLADLAVSLKREKDQTDALATACQHPSGAIPLYRDIPKLLRVLLLEDRLTDVIAILTNLGRFEWGNLDLRNQLIYLRCLSGVQKPSEVITEMKTLVQGEPGDNYLRDLGFVMLMGGQAPQAVELLKPVERRTGNDRLLEAVLGTALKASGRGAEAEALLSRIKWSAEEMIPAEARVLKRLIAEAPHSPPSPPAREGPPEQQMAAIASEMAAAAGNGDMKTVERLQKEFEALKKTVSGANPE